MIDRKCFVSTMLKRVQDGDLNFTLGIWQCRPRTAARVIYHTDDDYSVEGIGFTRVSWADTWNEEIGKEIAIAKALAHIWRQMLIKSMRSVGE